MSLAEGKEPSGISASKRKYKQSTYKAYSIEDNDI